MEEKLIGNGGGTGNGNYVQRYANKRGNLTMRDLVAVVYRRKRLILHSFLWMFAAVLLVAIFYVNRHYTSELEIIVNNLRADPYVTSASSQQQLQVTQLSDTTTEDALNSEIELLKGKDLLEKVVVDAGLNKKKGLMDYLPFVSHDPKVKIARLAAGLGSALDIEFIKKTFMLKVTYGSSSPAQSQRVLACLAKEYMAKHLAVHRPGQVTPLFARETNQWEQRLLDTEARMAQFDNETSTANPALARDTAVQKLADFDASLRTTEVQIAQTQKQISDIRRQMAKMSPRVVTVESSQDAWSTLNSARTELLDLEIKRTDLLTRYQPNYPLVQSIDGQIAQAKVAIQKAEMSPTKTTTTDNDPTYQMLQEDLAKAESDLAGYEAAATSYAGAVGRYTQDTIHDDQTALKLADLQRNAKADGDNFLLYLQKTEQARIDEALDNQRILNVAVAEEPVLPLLPFFSPVLFTILGAICAALLAVIFGFIADYYDPAMHTAEQVTRELDLPVIASIPKSAN